MKHWVMKAYNRQVVPEQFRYPIFVQRKYDGIRVAMQREFGDDFRTAQGKAIPNKVVREWLTNIAVAAGSLRLDGELIIEGLGFHEIQSWIMSENKGWPLGLKLVVFDISNIDDTYFQRVHRLGEHISYQLPLSFEAKRVVFPESCNVQLNNPAEFNNWNEANIHPEWEGLMIKWIDMPYKFGRCTLKEGYMFKWCDYVRDEATIVDVNIQQDWSPLSRMGSLTVESLKFGRFDIGSGFNNEQRFEFWMERAKMIGKTVTFKYKPFGIKEKPRSPIFVGIRYDNDAK